MMCGAANNHKPKYKEGKCVALDYEKSFTDSRSHCKNLPDSKGHRQKTKLVPAGAKRCRAVTVGVEKIQEAAEYSCKVVRARRRSRWEQN